MLKGGLCGLESAELVFSASAPFDEKEFRKRVNALLPENTFLSISAGDTITVEATNTASRGKLGKIYTQALAVKELENHGYDLSEDTQYTEYNPVKQTEELLHALFLAVTDCIPNADIRNMRVAYMLADEVKQYNKNVDKIPLENRLEEFSLMSGKDFVFQKKEEQVQYDDVSFEKSVISPEGISALLQNTLEELSPDLSFRPFGDRNAETETFIKTTGTSVYIVIAEKSDLSDKMKKDSSFNPNSYTAYNLDEPRSLFIGFSYHQNARSFMPYFFKRGDFARYSKMYDFAKDEKIRNLLYRMMTAEFIMRSLEPDTIPANIQKIQESVQTALRDSKIPYAGKYIFSKLDDKERVSSSANLFQYLDDIKEISAYTIQRKNGMSVIIPMSSVSLGENNAVVPSKNGMLVEIPFSQDGQPQDVRFTFPRECFYGEDFQNQSFNANLSASLSLMELKTILQAWQNVGIPKDSRGIFFDFPICMIYKTVEAMEEFAKKMQIPLTPVSDKPESIQLLCDVMERSLAAGMSPKVFGQEIKTYREPASAASLLAFKNEKLSFSVTVTESNGEFLSAKCKFDDWDNGYKAEQPIDIEGLLDEKTFHSVSKRVEAFIDSVTQKYKEPTAYHEAKRVCADTICNAVLNRMMQITGSTVSFIESAIADITHKADPQKPVDDLVKNPAAKLFASALQAAPVGEISESPCGTSCFELSVSKELQEFISKAGFKFELSQPFLFHDDAEQKLHLVDMGARKRIVISAEKHKETYESVCKILESETGINPKEKYTEPEPKQNSGKGLEI